jgi:hypothetical protein
MNRVVLSVLLLGGWLLMFPPRGEQDRIRSDAPIVQWQQESAHDTAKECEAAKRAIIVAARRAKASGWERLRDEDARCVPAESVYPPLQSPTPPK